MKYCKEHDLWYSVIGAGCMVCREKEASPASAGYGLMERLRAHIKEKKEDLAAAEFMARNESLRDKEAWAGIADKDRAEIALFEEIENVLGQNSVFADPPDA